MPDTSDHSDELRDALQRQSDRLRKHQAQSFNVVLTDDEVAWATPVIGRHAHGCGHGCSCHQQMEARCVLCCLLTTEPADRAAVWAARWPDDEWREGDWQTPRMSETAYAAWLFDGR